MARQNMISLHQSIVFTQIQCHHILQRIILYRRLTLIIQASYREQQTSASMQEQSMQVRHFIIHL